MADMKFACPSCAQHITCDELWAGQQIQCPSCQGTLTVPSRPAPAAAAPESLVPKPPAATRLATKVPAQQPAQTGAASGRVVPIRNLAPPKPPKRNLAVTLAKVAAVLVVLGVGGYFGWGFIAKMQDKASAKSREAEKDADGGQVGHINELYSVLDATEPGGAGLGGGSQRGSGPRQRSSGVGQEIPMAGDEEVEGAPKAPAQKLPVIPAVYTLDAQRAKIPEGRVNGKISGTNFVVDVVRLDRSQTSYLLRLMQGTVAAPEREIRVYLRLKSGEKIAGQKLEISPEMKGTGVPQVVKAWKTNPRYAAQTKTYGTGYVLKLELGEISEGAISGKIFVALPDPEATVAAGVFRAETSLVEGEDATAVVPTVAPVPGQTSPESEAFRKRYGR